jgi:UbiD family decarboxylase
MSDQSMRAFLAALEACGELHRVRRPVDLRFELAAVLSLRERGPAQLFERVGNHSMPVVANLLTSRERMARALGIARGELHAFCLAALRNPIAPVMVEHGAVQEVEQRSNLVLGDLLPVPTWFERENGPYITAGVIVAKDPETGRRNASIARLRLEGGARLMAGIAAQPRGHGRARGPSRRADRGDGCGCDRQSRGDTPCIADVMWSWVWTSWLLPARSCASRCAS